VYHTGQQKPAQTRMICFEAHKTTTCWQDRKDDNNHQQ